MTFSYCHAYTGYVQKTLSCIKQTLHCMDNFYRVDTSKHCSPNNFFSAMRDPYKQTPELTEHLKVLYLSL